MRATTKESTGGPPIAAQPCVGSPAWLIASRPHGKPPHGQRSRNASAATHQPATASGHQRRLSSSRWAMANTAKMSAEAMASATQANQARLTTQASSGMKNARPKAKPDRERAAQRAAVQRDHQQRRADDRERPDAGRRERGGEQQAAGQPGGQRQPQPQQRPRRQARRGEAGRRPRRRWCPCRPARRRACSVITLRRVVGVRPRREAGNFAIYREHGNPLRYIRCCSFSSRGPLN